MTNSRLFLFKKTVEKGVIVMKMVADKTITYTFKKKRLIELFNQQITKQENDVQLNLEHFEASRKITKLLIVDEYEEQDFFSMFTFGEIQEFVDSLMNWPDYNCDEEDIASHPIAQVLSFQDVIYRAKRSKSKERKVFI